MKWFGVLGIVALILGLLHLANSKIISKIDEFGKERVVTMKQIVKQYPRILGALYIIAAIILIHIGFFLKIK